MNQINIEIAYALPERYYLKSFQVDEGITVQTAITQSGILSQFPDIDLSTNKIGIFSRPIKLTDVLKRAIVLKFTVHYLLIRKKFAVNVQQSKLQPKTKKKELKNDRTFIC